jgi:RNA polymerase sigma factor (sigma-70 family)
MGELLESMCVQASPIELNWQSDVRKAQGGDQGAYARLINGTRGLVCSVALSVVHDVVASQDVAQEVYLAVWQNLSRLRNPSAFLPWLRQLTRNRAHDHLRAQRRRAGAPDGDAAMLEVADARPNAPEQLIARQDEQALAAAFAELPDEAREVLALYYREGRSAAQVAALLGLTEVAVKKRLSRAREVLRHGALERLGELLERSAPSAAFTAAVLAALASGAPATACAAGLAKASATGSAKLGSKVAAALAGGAGAGVLLGALGGVTGVVLEVRRVLRRARDDQERRELKRFLVVNTILVLLTVGGMTASELIHRGGVATALVFALSFTVMAHNYAIWLPRIIARRNALERAEDPRAAARQRRERVLSLLGLVAGGLAGGGVLIWAIWSVRHGH